MTPTSDEPRSRAVGPPAPTPTDVPQTPARVRDRELVARVLAGLPGAFEELHDRYEGRVQAFALSRLGDPAEAEDVVQDVFLEVFRCLDRFEGRSTLLTWIFGIAHHQICNRHRRRTPLLVSMDEPWTQRLAHTQAPTDATVDAARVLDRCEAVLSRELSSGQREIFARRYRDNESLGSIAKQLGKSTQAVKISLFRARRTLAERTQGLREALSA
ncbi:MAG: sigma-70 family RNA polymerase sigma factor [Proteobacteria bacterium]|nr:sigma-70 family RNA polymerase sigma factor [Pseudomonadota bacterium]